MFSWAFMTVPMACRSIITGVHGAGMALPSKPMAIPEKCHGTLPQGQPLKNDMAMPSETITPHRFSIELHGRAWHSHGLSTVSAMARHENVTWRWQCHGKSHDIVQLLPLPCCGTPPCVPLTFTIPAYPFKRDAHKSSRRCHRRAL